MLGSTARARRDLRPVYSVEVGLHAKGDVFMPFPARFEPVKLVRSTLLMSSFATLKDAGYAETYLRALPKEHHATVVNAVAGMWVPLDVAMAHYAACDSLGLSPERQAALGRGVGERVQGTLLGTVTRMAREVGVTPWNVIPQFQRFWDRAFDGGGLRGTRLGPKEARIETHKTPFCDYAYFRNSLRGLMLGVIDLFCTKAYASEVKGERAPGTVTFRVQWA
jgi:hypothetical protein